MADRKIRAGYYRRYDGKVFYLVTNAKDLETGEETVILRPYVYARNGGKGENAPRKKIFAKVLI